MKIISKILKFLILLLLEIGFQFRSNDDANNKPQQMNIVETAITTSDSLVAAFPLPHQIIFRIMFLNLYD